ncbi:nitrilase protein [Trichuris trichiura]|uniref:Nitrilase protein n=1 Tax=Trichuris trichiura TaxID=36087 RepID=A0A077Z8S8_TRITR|nr:nitrilase protein [Trichuris trichiura]
MARYFDVDKFFTDVQNSKIQLESLSERLERLKDSISTFDLENAKENEKKLPFRFRTNKLYEDVPAYGRRFVHDWERRFREDMRKQTNKANRFDSVKHADNQFDSAPVVKARKSQRTEASPTKAAPDEFDNLKQKLRALKAKGMELRQSVMNLTEKEAAANEVSRATRSPALEKSITQGVRKPTERLASIPAVDIDLPVFVREHRTRAKERAPLAPAAKAVGKSEDVLRRIRPLYESRASKNLRSRSAKVADANFYPGSHYDMESLDSAIEKIRKRYFDLMGPDVMYRNIRHSESPARDINNEASANGKVVDASVQASVEEEEEEEHDDNDDEDATPPKSKSSNASSIAANSNLSTSPLPVSPSGRAGEDYATLDFKNSSAGHSPKAEEPIISASSDEQDSKTPTPTPLVLNAPSSSNESVVTVQPSVSEPLSPEEEISKATSSPKESREQRVSKKTARTESEISEIPLEANSATTPSASRSVTKANSGQSQNSWKTEEEIFGRDMVKNSRRIYGAKSDEHNEDNLHRWASIHMKALRAYFEVQIALLHCEKKIGHRKNAEEYAKFIDEQVSDLKQKFERESQSLQGSVVSVVDEQREAQAKRLIKERKALEKDAKIVAMLESKAFKAWSLPAGLWMMSSSLSSSSEATTNGRPMPHVIHKLNAENDALTPLSGRSEYNARIQTLKKELEQRKNVARKLTYEYNQRSKQHLLSHEQSLAKQIEIYEGNIQKTEQMISDLTSAKGREEVHSSPRIITSPRSSAPSARQPDVLIEQPKTQDTHIDVLNLENNVSMSSGPSLSESEANIEDAQSDHERISENAAANLVDVAKAALASSSDTSLANSDRHTIDIGDSSPKPDNSFGKVGIDDIDNAVSKMTIRLLDNVATSCQDTLRQWKASPEARSDMPGVISTFDAISPRLLHSSRLKAAEFPTTPLVPKLELRSLTDEAEKDGVALLNANATPRLDVDSYSNLTPTPLVSSSKEAVKAIVRVSVDCLLKQLATGQSLWKTPKAAELYFVACELSNHRRGNSEQFDHLFRDFIFDLCRDFVANIYGCNEKADCIGEPGCRYALSSQVIKGNDEMVKRLVDLLVLQSIFSSSRHPRIDAVARRSWDDVDNRILSEMYEQDAVFFNPNTVEEEVLNASADVIVSQEIPTVVEECLRLIRP